MSTSVSPDNPQQTKLATVAMSWFWFPEAQYGCAPGVVRSKVGYTGGTTKFPTYRNLGDHTETVQIEFDPSKTSFEELLVMFWKNHDPTAVNKPQYMSAIFCHDDEQLETAKKSMELAKKSFRKPITTKILRAETFYDAEDYHQKYLLRQHPWLLNSLDIDPEELLDSHVCCRLNGYVAGYGDMKEFEKEWPKLNLNEKQVVYVKKAAGRGLKMACH